MKKKLLLGAALLWTVVASSLACTNLIVGNKASVDGSVIISYAADSYSIYGELYHYPAATYKKSERLKVYEWDTGKYLGEIDQASQTYNVIGNMNEFQLSIAETTFGGREELVNPEGLIDYGSLIYIALQRSRTARQAIRVMTELVQEYGYCSSGESFTIADPSEVWVMELIGKGREEKGAVWVAVRIPDDCISAHANQARIHQFNLNDKENCVYSPDVISFAREKGYFSGTKNTDFSFADAYAPLDFGARRYCEARVWSFFNKFTQRGDEFLPYILGQTNEPMPLYLKPSRKLSVADIQNAMRDHFEGTPLDLSNDFGAGPYHTPYRPGPLSFRLDENDKESQEYFNERPISTQQTGFVFVAQMRQFLEDPIGGVLWFGTDDANMTVYTPVYCCTDRVPTCYTCVDGADYVNFSWKSSFWINNWVANMVYPRYDLMIGDVRRVQSRLETNFFKSQSGIEKIASEMYASNPEACKAYLTDYTNMVAQHTLETWKELGEYLVVKYSDFAIRKTDKDGKFMRNEIGRPEGVTRMGYTQEYKEEYVRQTGDRYKVTD